METRKPFETIAFSDPAIDWDAVKNPPLVDRPCPACGPVSADETCEACKGSGTVKVFAYEPYDEVRFAIERDISKVLPHCFEGQRPTIYVYRRLTRPQRQKFVSQATSKDDLCIRAFQAGVVEIRFPDRPAYRPAWLGRAALTMDEKELASLEDEYGLEYFDEVDIGGQILARSDVPLDCTPVFQVLPSSVDAWGAVQRRCAARKQTGAPSTSGERRAP